MSVEQIPDQVYWNGRGGAVSDRVANDKGRGGDHYASVPDPAYNAGPRTACRLGPTLAGWVIFEAHISVVRAGALKARVQQRAGNVLAHRRRECPITARAPRAEDVEWGF